LITGLLHPGFLGFQENRRALTRQNPKETFSLLEVYRVRDKQQNQAVKKTEMEAK
jgi:hypothetical protein